MIIDAVYFCSVLSPVVLGQSNWLLVSLRLWNMPPVQRRVISVNFEIQKDSWELQQGCKQEGSQTTPQSVSRYSYNSLLLPRRHVEKLLVTQLWKSSTWQHCITYEEVQTKLHPCQKSAFIAREQNQAILGNRRLFSPWFRVWFIV